MATVRRTRPQHFGHLTARPQYRCSTPIRVALADNRPVVVEIQEEIVMRVGLEAETREHIFVPHAFSEQRVDLG